MVGERLHGVLESTGVVGRYAHCDLAWGWHVAGAWQKARCEFASLEKPLLARWGKYQEIRMCYALRIIIIIITALQSVTEA